MEVVVYDTLNRINTFCEEGSEFMRKWQDQMQLIAALSARVSELEEFKNSIQKLPHYEEWVAAYNCGGYHD